MKAEMKDLNNNLSLFTLLKLEPLMENNIY